MGGAAVSGANSRVVNHGEPRRAFIAGLLVGVGLAVGVAYYMRDM